MFVQRRAGWLVAGLVLAFGLLLSAGAVGPSALGAAGPGADGPGRNLYAPVVQRLEPTLTPTATPTPAAGCSAAPVLLAPANNAALNTLIPVLEWDSGQNPNVTETNVQVYANAALTQRVDWFLTRYRTTGPISWQPSDNYNPARTYYWLAFLRCGDAQGPNSEVRSFTTGSSGVILPAPGLVQPADGAQLSGTTATVSWSAVSDALGYEQYMVTSDSRMWRNTTSASTVWSGLGANTVYEWYVRARNGYAWGVESAHWHFTTGAAAPWSDVFRRPGGEQAIYADGGGRLIEVDRP